jgi:hypothetical protein
VVITWVAVIIAIAAIFYLAVGASEEADMCFTLLWFRDLLIWIVILVAVVALLKLLLPWLVRQLSPQFDLSVILRAIDIFVWAVVVIFVIYLVFALISCLAGGAGTLPLFPRAR